MLGNQTKKTKSGVLKSNKKVSKYELDIIIPLVIKDLKTHHWGKENAITSCIYRNWLYEEHGIECQDSRLRGMIKYIQSNGLCKYIVSSHCGFFYTRKKSDVIDMAENLKKREDELRELRRILLNQVK